MISKFGVMSRPQAEFPSYTRVKLSLKGEISGGPAYLH